MNTIVFGKIFIIPVETPCINKELNFVPNGVKAINLNYYSIFGILLLNTNVKY